MEWAESLYGWQPIFNSQEDGKRIDTYAVTYPQKKVLYEGKALMEKMV